MARLGFGPGDATDGGPLDGSPVDGVDAAPDGATPDGATPDGATPDGATPDGAASDGPSMDASRAGTLDPAFGAGGVAIGQVTGMAVQGIAVRPDGRILLAGTYEQNVYVARLLSDGSADPGFNANGSGIPGLAGSVLFDPVARPDEVRAISLQGDGRILVAGWSRNANPQPLIVRFTADGPVDDAFAGDGNGVVAPGEGFVQPSWNNVWTWFIDVFEQANGNVIGVGPNVNGTVTRMQMMRWDTAGALDTSYAANGHYQPGIEIGTDCAAVHPEEGTIFVSGLVTTAAGTDMRVVKVGLDPTYHQQAFGPDNGVVDVPFPPYTQNRALAIDVDAKGRILIGGFAANTRNADNQLAVARLLPTGSLDDTFNGNGDGVVTGTEGRLVLPAATVQTVTRIFEAADGSIIVVGHEGADGTLGKLLVGRLTSAGQADPCFDGPACNGSGVIVYDQWPMVGAISAVMVGDALYIGASTGTQAAPVALLIKLRL